MAHDAVGGHSMSLQFCRLHGFARDSLRPHTLRMTIDAILHRKRLKRPWRGASKRFHRAMAGLAFDLCCRYVNLVRKKNVRRQAPDSSPRNFLSLFPVSSDLLDFRALSFSAAVTTKTQRRGRPPGNCIFFRTLMACRAWQTERDVGLVRKRDRLFDAAEYSARPVAQSRHSGHNYQDQNNSFHRHPFNYRESSHPMPCKITADVRKRHAIKLLQFFQEKIAFIPAT